MVLIAVSALFNSSCRDINTSKAKIDGIKSVVPARGGYGARVVISGNGFQTLQKITFNGTEAAAVSATDSVIVTRVPAGATTGPLELTVNGEVMSGPVFTVDPTQNLYLFVDEIIPLKAHLLDTVKITGSGFTGVDELAKLKRVEAAEREKPAPLFLSETGSNFDERDRPRNGKILLEEPGAGERPAEMTPQRPETKPHKAAQNIIEEISVWFAGAEAEVMVKSDSVLLAVVPENALSGPVTITTPADTALGPEFRVLKHAITGISPSSGPEGTEVTISGVDFSETPAKNVVTFGGEPAPVLTASETKLVVQVPEGAETGKVAVSINGIVKEGPVFTVGERSDEKILNVIVETLNAPSGHDGYNLKVSGEADRWIAPDADETYTGITADEVLISLNDGPESCAVAEGPNPRLVQLEPGTTIVHFLVTCVDYLTIDDITPELGSWGTEVTISGAGFGNRITDVKVWFPETEGIIIEGGVVHKTFAKTPIETLDSIDFDELGVEAEVLSVTNTEIVVKVPRNAGTGPIIVTVFEDGILSKIGETPVFTLEAVSMGRTLTVHVTTNNASSGHDGYNLSVTGEDDRWIAPTTTAIYNNIILSEVDVTLDTEYQSCVLAEQNTQTVVFMEPSAAVYFTLNCVPVINDIEPDSGQAGSHTYIHGEGFNDVMEKNKVFFSGENGPVEGQILESSRYDLMVEVPAGAVTGPVTVVSDGVSSAGGPEFTVVEAPYNLTVRVKTINGPSGHDGYGLNVTGQDYEWIFPNDDFVFSDLSEGVYTVELVDGPPQCMAGIQEGNPQQITLQPGENTVYFTIECAPEPEIYSYDPDSGPVGSEVTIIGANFSTNSQENIVWFYGADDPAVVIGGTDNKLLVEVPEGAETGPVSIELYWYYASGPDFVVTENLSDKVVFSAEVSGNYQIFSMDPYSYSSVPEQITTGAGDHLEPVISPDGNFIAYRHQTSPGSTKIRVAYKDGSVKAEFYADKFNVRPSWSPDGTKVVFSGGDYNENVDLYLYDLRTESITKISDTHSTADQYPSWSSAGKIIYSSFDENTERYQLRTVNPDGTQNTLLYESLDPFYDMKWSPDGTQFTYAALDSGNNMRIHISNGDGTNLHFMKEWGENERYPSWSPDGSRIIYSVDYSGSHALYFFDLDVQDGASVLTTGDNIHPSWGAN